MKAEYQIADRQDSRVLAQFLSREGQALLPMLELIERAEMAVDELIDVAGRATIEAVLTLSAREVAGPSPTYPLSVFATHVDGLRLCVRLPLRRKQLGGGSQAHRLQPHFR